MKMEVTGIYALNVKKTMRRKVVFDIECDGLLQQATKIHCLCYQWEDEEEVKQVTDSQRIKQFFLQENVIFTGHNIITYDLQVVKKLLGVEVDYKMCVDTLALSWHLYEDRILHGLDSWGKDFGIEKPKVDDWEGLTVEEYLHRCSEDVKINMRLWKQELDLLNQLYEGEQEPIDKLLRYLSFKLDCVREQEEVGVYLDIPRIEAGIERLNKLAEDKVEKLKQVMPKIPIVTKKTKPPKMYNIKGGLTVAGTKWLELLQEHNIPENYEGTVEYISGYQEPNPNSVPQKKDWLFSLGWVPEHIKYDRDKKTNKVTEIPQIVGKIDKTEVCPSIKKLFPKEPALEELNGLGIINHRLGILKGFMRDQVDGKIYASASAITSTMRLKHKCIVNLPAYNAPYAEEIRSSLIAPPGHVLINADLSSAEDLTKRHYLFPYDPDYVIEMSDPNYSPHTDIAVLAGLMTREEEEFYKKVDKMEDKSSLTEEEIKEFKRLKDVRHKGKTCNFSATYFIGATALGRALNVKKSEAEKILNAYWEKNKAVKEYCENCQVKEIDGRNWILNEVSGHWLPLRHDKDRLSATNQSTAVYVFDIWLMFIRSQGIKVAWQVHDELNVYCSNNNLGDYIKIINESMNKVNKAVKLNVEMGCSIQYAHRYSDAH